MNIERNLNMDMENVNSIVPLEQRLSAVQSALRGEKSNNNDFGNYKYRNVEDILTEVKPLLIKHRLSLRITDQLVIHPNYRVYVQACVIISDLDGEIIDQSGNLKEIITIAYAREAEKQGGMSASQITGSASSYARKYALGGMFLLSGEACPDYASQLEGMQTPPKPSADSTERVQDKDKDKDKDLIKNNKRKSVKDMLNEQK